MTAPASPSESPLRLLLVGDAEAETQGWLDALAAAGRPAAGQRVNSGPGLRGALQGGPWDAVLTVYKAARFSAAGVLRTLRDVAIDLPVVVVAEPDQSTAAFELMRVGARDVVTRDQLPRLAPVMARETAEARERADHRAALAMLDESEARLRALASNIPGMVFQLQRDEAGQDRFLFVSEGCTSLLGLRQHELLASPRRFFLRFVAEDRPGLERVLAESVPGKPLQWEGRVRHGNGKWVSLRSVARRLPDGGTLWAGIVSDISDSKEVERALVASRAQLSELSSHLEAVKEEERERIARDIHDELGSILVAVKIEVSLLASKLPAAPTGLRDKAHSVETLLDQAMGTASRVARELRPGILKEFGLPAAIECQAEDFAQRTGITCRVQSDDYYAFDEGGEPDENTSLALFRIFQEALTNVAKHAHASLVAVRLGRERDNILMEIRDNGLGISSDDMSKPKSFGLRGIRERVSSLGGEFTVTPGEQGGTRILLAVPCGKATEPPVREEEAQRNLF